MSVEDSNRWIEWQNSIRGRTVPRTELAQDGQTGQAVSTAPPDFMWIVTAIARLYAQDHVLEMQQLDNSIQGHVGEGTTFRVSSVEAPSTTLSHKTANTAVNKLVKVVLKQTPPGIFQRDGTVSGSQAKRAAESLLMEIRILGHPEIRSHANIVNMLGIGWQYSTMALPSPHPIPILEQASCDLAEFQSSNPKIPFETKRTICLDVARGLQVLHNSGVAHCDIKPRNILIFEEEDQCVAKVTDFSLSILDTSAMVSIGGRTPGYNAPEWEKSMTFSDVKKTDTYSYGVLFSSVMVGYDVVQAFYDGKLLGVVNDGEAAGEALEKLKANNAFKSHVLTLLHNTDDAEVFAMEDYWSTIALQRNVLECTLELDPLSRDLDKAISLLDHEARGWHRTAAFNTVTQAIEGDILSVPYQSMGCMSRILKKQIVDSLRFIANNATDDKERSAAACYELCICYLTGFGVSIDNDVAASWFIEAGTRGEKFARAMVHHVLSSLGRVDALERHDMEAWLCEAAGLGSWAALDGLEAIDSAQLTAAIADHRRYLCHSFSNNPTGVSVPGLNKIQEVDEDPIVWLHEDARLGNMEAFEAEQLRKQGQDTSISDIINQRDHNGDTPLLCACRAGQFDIVSRLLELDVDVSQANDLGENCLHLLLCLRTAPQDKLSKLVTKMFEHGVDWTFHAHGSSISGEFEQGLIIAGCPRTRAANFNAPEILDLLYSRVDANCRDSKSDDQAESALARRLIAFACRSHNYEVLEILTRYRPTEFHHNILPYNWLWNNGRKYSLVAFAINGCVANRTVASTELPEKFWRVLNHGVQSVQALQKTLDLLHTKGIEFSTKPDGKSATALIFAIRSSNLDAVNFLLQYSSDDDKFAIFDTPWLAKERGSPNHREKMGLVATIREAIYCSQLDIFHALLRWDDHESLRMGKIVQYYVRGNRKKDRRKTRIAEGSEREERNGADFFPSCVCAIPRHFHVPMDQRFYDPFKDRDGGERTSRSLRANYGLPVKLPSLERRRPIPTASTKPEKRRPYTDATLNYSLLYMTFIAEAEHRDIEFADVLLSTKREISMTEHYQWHPRNHFEWTLFSHPGQCPLLIAAYSHWTELAYFLMRNGADLRVERYRNQTILTKAMESKEWEVVTALLTSATELLPNGKKPEVEVEMKQLLDFLPRSRSSISTAMEQEVTRNLINNFKALEMEQLTSRLNPFVAKATRQGRRGALRALLEHGCSADGTWSSVLSFTPLDYVYLHMSASTNCTERCDIAAYEEELKTHGGHRRGLLSCLELQLVFAFFAGVLFLGLIPATYYSFVLVNDWHIPYFIHNGKRVEDSSSGPAKFWITCGVWFSFFAYAFPLLIGAAVLFISALLLMPFWDDPYVVPHGYADYNYSRWQYIWWWMVDPSIWSEFVTGLLFPLLTYLYMDNNGCTSATRSIKRDLNFLHFSSINLLVHVVSGGRVSRSWGEKPRIPDVARLESPV